MLDKHGISAHRMERLWGLRMCGNEKLTVFTISRKETQMTSAKLNAKIKNTVAKIDRLRTDIDAIAAEIEGVAI
jgi:hypothetical protein